MDELQLDGWTCDSGEQHVVGVTDHIQDQPSGHRASVQQRVIRGPTTVKLLVVERANTALRMHNTS